MTGEGVQRVAPPYQQIADHYAAEIAAGRLRPGDYLPTLPQLVETWGVSRVTASKATDRLKVMGLVETVTSKGIRVVEREQPERQPRQRKPRPAPRPAARRDQ